MERRKGAKENQNYVVWFLAPLLLKTSKKLEVKSENKLHRTATWIVRCRNILVSSRDRTKGRTRISRRLQTQVGRSEFSIINSRGSTNEEVDVIEYVQHLDTKLDVRLF